MAALFICLCCGKEKVAEPRSGSRQSYCAGKRCQKARKAAWQKQSLMRDVDHRANQRRSQGAWRRTHPEYWSNYRRKNPEKAERNRQLQRCRDQKRRQASAQDLANMDALNRPTLPKFQDNQEFWLIPDLAKMDALRVKIVAVTGS